MTHQTSTPEVKEAANAFLRGLTERDQRKLMLAIVDHLRAQSRVYKAMAEESEGKNWMFRMVEADVLLDVAMAITKGLERTMT